MDELLHHCLRELSFDGDLGCCASKLKDFVDGFYLLHSSSSQNADDAFCSFIWSLVVQNPTVIVGLMPEGVTSEVWIAPQTSAKRKAKASGQEHVRTTPARLEPIPDARTTPLEKLNSLYGDRLRIAVDPDSIFAAITGSHIRTSKLSPMVYSALQVITQGRDDGVTVVELGQRTKYDQKTCFYLVRQLTEMDLVVKVRRGGVGTHFCIHKHFYDRSPSWKAIREEEERAKDDSKPKEPLDDNDDDNNTSVSPMLDFTPIDSRHLSSLPLVKARVIKLLKASKNHLHASNNMLITLGFTNPTKTDRRFFQSRIRELLQQGIIEKVIFPSNKKKSNGSSVKCFRLIAENESNHIEGAVVVPTEDDKEDDTIGEEAGVKANITIHKQILDLLEETGTVGMTLNELSSTLSNFDKRTIELLLARAEKSHPPQHLADLGIAGLMETNKRERRHRYYTVSAYQKLVVAEQLDKSAAGFNNVDLTHSGNFYEMPSDIFYDDIQVLHRFQDTFTRESKARKPNKRQYKNPILPDGSVKQGRPRKVQPDGQTKSLSKDFTRKRKSPTPDDVAEQESRPPMKRSRAAQKGKFVEQDPSDGAPSVQHPDVEAPILVGASSASTPVPKKRGRPPKRTTNPLERAQTQTTRTLRGQKAKICDSRGDVTMSEIPESSNAALQSEEGLSVAQPTPPPPREPSTPDSIEVTQLPPCSSALSAPLTLSAPPETPSNARVSRGRVNVSHLRRENEIFRVIEEAGGIVNIQTKEFIEAHMALLETLTRAGEPTSAPVGTRTDKRTVAITIDSLERKGKVKQLKTSFVTHTGLNKPATVVHLPRISTEQLSNFLADIARVSQPSLTPSNDTVKIAEPLEYGADPGTSSRGVLPLQLLQLDQPGEKKERWSKNATRATQLFNQPDAAIRDVLLAERTTVGQLYGYIVGKAARAENFHLTTLETFESNAPSPHIIPAARVVELNYFCQDVSVSLYTKFVSTLGFSDRLSALYQTESGKSTPVKDLPQDLHTLLQVGRSRCRARILDIFAFLQELQVVVPLKPTTSESPYIKCEAREEPPTAFDIWEDTDWTPSTPNIAPTYWHFKLECPVHLWRSSESAPPLWKTVATSDVESARQFWNLLRSACVEPFLPDTIAGGILPEDTTASGVSIGRSLRRAVSWNAGYVLTWHQARFLEKSIDMAAGHTALDEADEHIRSEKVRRLCWVTSAPQAAVEAHLKKACTRVQNEKEKLATKNKEVKRMKRLAESRSSILKKAEEAKKQRENEWNTLLCRTHPEPTGAVATRIERIRTKFLQAGSVRDLEKWERAITDAVREVGLTTGKVLSVTGRRPGTGRSVNGSTGNDGGSSIVTSIEALIDQQQPLLAQGVYKRKSKSMKKVGIDPFSEAEKKGTRRHRFQWNKDYDELAQDASVIIRARCRNLPRLEWTALEQVFPAVPRNTVRQRLSNLREIPGNDSYLRRLEDRWYDLWVQLRGTDELPDEQPGNPSNFELIQHIEYLRSHVDKNALRIGFGKERATTTATIPNSVEHLLTDFNVVEDVPTTTTWDFVWNAAVEEGREKRLLSLPFAQSVFPLSQERAQDGDVNVLGEAALKMVMGSLPETYDCDVASALLRSVGDDVVAIATQNLLNRGVLSKSQRDPQKQKPGRQLKISDSNQNVIGGSIPRDTYQDATSFLESAYLINDWREWPLTATDGDTLSLIHLVAESQVQFKIDTTQARAAREDLDWNSKRADDDQIETGILAKYALPVGQELTGLSRELDNEMDVGEEESESMDTTNENHGSGVDNLPACCRRTSERGVVDCLACLQDARTSVEQQMSEEQTQVLSRLFSFIKNTGKEGCTKSCLEGSGFNDAIAAGILKRVADLDVPLLCWVGYASLRVVAAEFSSGWTVVVSEQPLERVFPRRWLNIHGVRIPDFWQAALRAAEIRWRLRTAYDRQEVLEVLAYMQVEGYLTVRQEITWSGSPPLDDGEEKTAFWFIGDKCWFQV